MKLSDFLSHRPITLSTLLMAIVLFMSACSESSAPLTPSEIVDVYFDGLNSSDFSKIKGILSDSVQSYEMKYTIAQGIEQHYHIFQWDSIFKPHYTVLNKKLVGSDFVEVEVLKDCDRISFLTDTSIVFKVNFSINDAKIESLNTCEYIRFDVNKWHTQLDTLTKWVATYHPELNGFAYDITLNGGLNYKKAIQLFETEKHE